MSIRSRIDQELRTRLGQARLVGLAGVVLALVGLALWVLFVLTLVSSGERFGGTDLLDEAVMANFVFALLALLSVLLYRWPLASAIVLFIAFVGSFLLGFGWYFIFTAGPLALVGAGSLVYLLAAVMMIVATFARPSRRERD